MKWRAVFQVKFPLEKGKVFIWEDFRNPKMLHSAGPLHQYYKGVVYEHHLLPMLKPFPGKWRAKCACIYKSEEVE
jgi:hypothetical protein